MKSLIERLILPVALCGVLSGCGAGSDGLPRAEIVGRVTVNNEPLKEGQITFVGTAADGATTGSTIVDGAFEVPRDKGPPPGEYAVQIRAYRGTGKKSWNGIGDASDPAMQVEEKAQFIPQKYNIATELKAQLSAEDANELAFDLTIPEGAKPGK